MRHYNVTIKGRVQGVTFRWSTKQKALGLHLFGFVQNEPDGSVYMEVEGQEEDLEEFLGWCHRGPLFSKVKDLKFEESNLKGYNTFEIKT
ncbi:MAG: acylphosphatase [Candidatus Doudnabacteria bacterium]|nr:acylphosphatase [Candidatus Doudnabacteria bacterium]